ncbi:metallophosphoesterase [Haloglomus halophilum]|uniref:metallophosphoesterase n=1 Tax=Haloglomus halophilum TaxID=2962672 RepID=UPI0020C9CB48|nr:metallophosphoesterase [Haloglomus halophilum]
MSTRGAPVEGVSFRDRAVYLERADALVLADTHLGRDESSNVQLRLGEDRDIVERVGALLERFDPAELVVAGDLLHSFSSVPRGVRESLRDLRAAVDEADAHVVITPGNHDTMLAELWDGSTTAGYPLVDGDRTVVVCHGHESPAETDVDGDADLYVVGHDHPTIEIEGKRRPCYLHGRGCYRGADLLMLPSFTRLAAGAPVNGMGTNDFMSPLVTDADLLRPVVQDERADETLAFPPLGRFREML